MIKTRGLVSGEMKTQGNGNSEEGSLAWPGGSGKVPGSGLVGCYR